MQKETTHQHCCHQDKPISEQNADDLLVRSSVNGPINQLGVMAKSLLFAELSMISYLPEEEVILAVDPLNFYDVTGCSYNTM